MLRPLPRIALLAACLAPLAGCASLLAPKVPPTRYYVLSATPPPGGAGVAPGSAADLTIGLGPVGVPGYLDRRELVTRVAPNRLEVAQLDLWGEPIGQNVKAVLAQDLASRLGGATVVVFPWNVGYAPDYRVRIDVARFEGTSDGDVVLAASWSVREERAKRTVTRRESLITEPVADGSADATVAALSAALGALADEIASAIATRPAAR